MKYFTLYIFLFFSLSNLAQNSSSKTTTQTSSNENKITSINNGPGGVNATNVFWVKADDFSATLSTDDPIDLWNDQSGNLNDAGQSVLSDRPSFNEILRNYNPSVYFDGTNEHLDIADLVAAGSSSISVFAVGTNEAGGDSWHSMVFGQANNNWSGGGYGICGLDPSSANFGFWIYQWGSNSVSSFFIEQPTAIIEGEYDGNDINLYYDAQFRGSDAYTNQIGDAGSTHLGGGNETSFNHKGHISEVIIYDTSLSDDDRKKVNSYLGLKYGITLDRIGMDGAYLNSLGNVVYSDEGTSAYWRDIIGIGRDDNGSLHQKQSHEFYDQSRIYLSSVTADNVSNTGNFSTDNQFAVMGNGGGLVSIRSRDVGNSEAPVTVHSRLERDWKLTNTDFTDTFSIDIRLNSCVDIPSIVDSELRLLVDDDTDFTNATVYQNGDDGLALSINGNIISISNISNTHMGVDSNSYFTIASVTANTLDLSFSAETIDNIYICDDLPNDGFADFPINLSDIETQVIGPYTALNLDVTYYDQSGNDLTLTEPFFTNTNSNTQTITVRVTHPFGCYDETSFDLIVIPTPIIENLTDVTECDSFILPNLTNGNYFTESDGTGTQLNAGDTITSSQTLYIYAENEIDTNICSNESSFSIGIGTTPTAESITNLYVCDAISNDGFAEFPIDTTNIENQVLSSQTDLAVDYYNENGDEIFLTNPYTNITANTQSITVRIEHPYGCADETTFDLIVVPMPVIAIPDDVSACDFYTLPILSVGSYFTEMNGTGIQLDPAIDITTSQTVYIYAENELDSNICSNESSFTISINTTPTADVLNDVPGECGSYLLPHLVSGNYFSESGATGIAYNYGDAITTTQTVYIFAETATTPNCTDESSFDVIIYPIIDFMLSEANIIIQDQNINVVMSDTSIEYEYALDNTNYQSENAFYYLSEEIHELFVRDIHGCVEKSILFNPAHNIVFRIIPNPTSGFFNIYSSEVVTKVEVFDVNSKLLISYPTVQDNYPIPNLVSGIYFVRIESETGFIGFERMIVY